MTTTVHAATPLVDEADALTRHLPHYPADPSRFVFDASVTEVFDSMAMRSIPLYEEAHTMHVRMLRDWLQEPIVKVLDVGASRGRFIDHIVAQHGAGRLGPQTATGGGIEITALDISQPMCDVLQARYPQVDVRQQDLATPEFLYGPIAQYDIICAYYVLQFLHPAYQVSVLRRLMALLKTGGVLIIGQKSAHGGRLGNLGHDYYIEWRMANGYSRAEIEAKTHALAGSMWPMDESLVTLVLKEQAREIFETTRVGVFNTLMARK